MPEDAEKRFERAMDRLFSSKSVSSPATPASSSAGAASPPKQGKKGIHTGDEAVNGSKGASVSRASGRPPRVAGHTPTHDVSTFSSHQPVCRPWDRGDLFRRLATFKSMTWFGKPLVAGPVTCARKGWVNVDVDLIACEGCNTKLSFPSPPSWSQQQVESAAAVFSEKLDTGHKALCPWKGNVCAETLAQFPPTQGQALMEGYKDRCDALFQLSALPVISSSAIDNLKLSRGSQIDCLLAQPPPNTVLSMGMLKNRAEGTGEGSLSAAICTYYQAQRLISLCGWEPRLLPYMVDCEDDSTQSARSTRVGGQDEVRSRRHSDPGPGVLLCSRTERLEEKGQRPNNPQLRSDLGSAVLDCSLCGASIGLWLFVAVPRPSMWTGSSSAQPPDAVKSAFEAPACGFSAASGIDLGYSGDHKRKDQVGQPDETGDAVTSVPPKSSSRIGVLDLNLTIAGGPPPTQLNSRGLIPLFFPPNPFTQSGIPQPESSEVGDWFVSNESYKPRDQRLVVGQVCSTNEKQASRMLHADTTGCISVDCDSEVDKLKGGIAESSKCEHMGGLSQSMAGDEVDEEGDGRSTRKRKRNELRGFGVLEDRQFVERSLRDIPRYSSVDAMDTCYHSRRENSIESVEMPQEADSQGTAVSGENNDHTVQAQQSTCGQTCGRHSKGLVGPVSSKNDEVDGDEGNDTSIAVISTGTGKKCGTSVGMGHGINYTSGSQETDAYHNQLSVPPSESGVGEVEDVADITGIIGQTSEVICEGERPGPEVVLGDNQEGLLLSHTKEKLNSGKGAAIMEGESGESGAKGGQGGMSDKAQEKSIAVRVINDKRMFRKEDINGCMEAVKAEVGPESSSGAIPEAERMLDSRMLWEKETREFDPVQQHRHFCPWVNANVTITGSSSDNLGGAMCGWQLTLDALETSPIVIESESASSMYNANPLQADPLASVRKIFGRSYTAQKKSKKQ